MKATILGGQGFIGRQLTAELINREWKCWVPERGDSRVFEDHLGTVFYCIGLTANFRSRPFATVDAHVGILRELLEQGSFDGLVYLSSTRVYEGCDTGKENEFLRVAPWRSGDIYNLSKLLGESLVLQDGRRCRVARLSNVIGPGMNATNFVGSLLHDAKRYGQVTLRTALTSSKDYIWIDDAVAGLIAIATSESEGVFNVASGENIRNAALVEILARQAVNVTVVDGAPDISFPSISTDYLVASSEWRPQSVLPRLEEFFAQRLQLNEATR